MKRRPLALLVALALSLGLTAQAGAASSATGFNDVNALDYFAEAVDWAVENSITQGTAAGLFLLTPPLPGPRR